MPGHLTLHSTVRNLNERIIYFSILDGLSFNKDYAGKIELVMVKIGLAITPLV